MRVLTWNRFFVTWALLSSTLAAFYYFRSLKLEKSVLVSNPAEYVNQSVVVSDNHVINDYEICIESYRPHRFHVGDSNVKFRSGTTHVFVDEVYENVHTHEYKYKIHYILRLSNGGSEWITDHDQTVSEEELDFEITKP